MAYEPDTSILDLRSPAKSKNIFGKGSIMMRTLGIEIGSDSSPLPLPPNP